MKSIEQLLELSKNPYYKMTEAEKAVLNDFLAKRQAERGTNSQSKNEKNSEKNTPVRVRNIVPKFIPEVEESGQ